MKKGAKLLNPSTAAVLRPHRSSSTSSSPSPSPSWDSLPVEIQLLILLRVPAAELARLRFVSKSFFEIICTKDFAHAHLAQPRPESEYSVIMKLWDDPSRRGYNYSHLKWDVGRDGSADLVYRRRLDIYGTGMSRFEHINVYSSCDGLILCSASCNMKYGFDYRNEDLRLFVCNPVTGLRTTLPRLSHGGYDYDNWILAFDRCAKKYKVVGVAFFEMGDAIVYRVIVFTVGDSEGSCWRTIPFMIPSLSVSALGDKSIWILSNRQGDALIEKYKLFSMDLNNEEIREISILTVDKKSRPWLMYEVDGRLYCGTGTFTGEIEIWCLKGITHFWMKLHSLSIPSLVPSHRGFSVTGIGAVGIIDNGKRIILYLQRRLPKTPSERLFFLFDLASKQTIHPLQLEEEEEDVIFCLEGLHFSPSGYLQYPMAHVDSLVSWA